MRLLVATTVISSMFALTANAGILEQRTAGLDLAERVYGSENPDEVIQSLNPEELELLKGVTTPGVLEESTEFLSTPRAYSGCWAMRTKTGRKALLGNTLYTYWQTTQVCVSSGKVTSVSITEADGETSTPGWRIAHDPTKATKNVGWEGRATAKYYFVLGAGPWDVQHPTDCLQLRLNGNGHDSRSLTDCSLDAP